MANEIMAISYDSADATEHAAFWSEVMDSERAAGASADFARLRPGPKERRTGSSCASQRG